MQFGGYHKHLGNTYRYIEEYAKEMKQDSDNSLHAGA